MKMTMALRYHYRPLWVVQFWFAALVHFPHLVAPLKKDWLIHKEESGFPSRVFENVCWKDGLCGLELSNGLLVRRWTLTEPAFGTVDLLMQDRHTGKLRSMLRAVEPEASIVLNGDEYTVGDLESTKGFRAYINRTSFKDSLRSIPEEQDDRTFRYVSHRVTNITKQFDWTPGVRHSIHASWPPKGIALEVDLKLRGANSLMDFPVSLTLHYELYDGIPVMAKWISVKMNNRSSISKQKAAEVVLNSATVEKIASHPPFGAYFSHGSTPPYSFFDGAASGVVQPPPLLVSLTDQAYGSRCHWVDDYPNSNDTDTDKNTPNDMGASEPLLLCDYTHGPGITLRSDAYTATAFTSFRTFLLATDSPEPERQSLMKHRMTQILLPHTTENPIFFHAVVHNDAEFRHVVDQMVEVGFEMLIYSFGSGFDFESINKTYIEQIKRQVDHANSKGIEVGGYDLICLDRGHGAYGNNIPDEWVRVDADGNLALDACYASGWYDHLNDLLFSFIDETGLTMVETDGPYGGGSCSSTDHAHHNGLEDSIYMQTKLQGEFFQRLRNMGVYINAPDTYFFQGSNRIGMGYNEHQYSLPRWKQLTISRMGMYDDLYRYLPTQGWMFVPLKVYHEGGEAATFANHPEELDWALAQYLGAGTAACYRGYSLYDESTNIGLEIKERMKRWISFYKAHREILINPVVHLRRPTMESWDGWLHVNPFGNDGGSATTRTTTASEEFVEVGLAMIFNPTDFHLSQESIVLPLYYTGLETEVWISVNEEAAPYSTTLERDYSVTIVLDMKPKSIHTVLLMQRQPQGDMNHPASVQVENE